MRAVIQRVSEARVTIGRDTVGQIGRGYMVLLGIEDVDTEQEDHAADEWRYACMSRPIAPRIELPAPARVWNPLEG